MNLEIFKREKNKNNNIEILNFVVEVLISVASDILVPTIKKISYKFISVLLININTIFIIPTVHKMPKIQFI